MINASALLKDLQQELTRTVADIGSHVAADGEVRGRLETEWKHAFDAHRTGRTFEAWLEDRLTQVGVGWLLAFVFVRFCEDNRLIAEPMISGPGHLGAVARASQQRYFAEHPHDSDREYLHGVFRHAAELPGLSGLLAEGESPLWLVDPPADACTRMLSLFRATDDESGELSHDFTDQDLDTRFLGDLYQDLSAQARADYALLQTPDFVEEFILDRTLTPAIEAFGLSRTTLIDPTCGSGHFLLGAFDRLWEEWRKAEPATSRRELAQRSLSSVTGVDLNPFAAAIARFRLLVAALKVSDVRTLRDSPDFSINVVVGDSLLWGARPGQLAGMESAAAAADRQFLYKTEHAADLQRVFATEYSAVVGNPPYIVARDKALNRQYRARYPDSCSGKYHLSAPFMERFFDLAFSHDRLGRPAGFVGLISDNQFMKGEFGKKLIERCIPRWDLTHVVDTSGASIPGHGTPTVILFGRHQPPVAGTIRTVMGIRGEPTTPIDPAQGRVWSAIVRQIDDLGSEGEYVSVADIDRARFAAHPWSIGGGGASELKERIDAQGEPLSARVKSIGFGGISAADDIMQVEDEACFIRHGLERESFRAVVSGDAVRNWTQLSRMSTLFPYGHSLLDIRDLPMTYRWLWRYRSVLGARATFSGSTYAEEGRPWWEWHQVALERLKTPLTIAFAEIATHNHFVLDRDGRVFKQTAPIMTLEEDATVSEHLAIIGVLNSSIAAFWLHQICKPKDLADQKWATRYVYNATKLQKFPMATGEQPLGIAQTIDSLASRLCNLQPSAVCASAIPGRPLLDSTRIEADRILGEMIAWQEELDWECLRLYGMVGQEFVLPEGEVPPSVRLGERAFEIVLARKRDPDQGQADWFARHGSTAVTELPAIWPDWYADLVQRRIGLISSDRDVALLEQPEHKRRWEGPSWEEREVAAIRNWLLERLEDRSLWFEGTGDSERALCRSIAQLGDKIAMDQEFLRVARMWRGVVEIDLTTLLAELLAEELVPVQFVGRFLPSGIATARQWIRTWELQRVEDRGESLPAGLERVPVPPPYLKEDFRRTSYWSLRGKFDVPRERFNEIVGAERDGDRTTVLAWAGFDHAQLAQAIGTLLVEREQTDGWDADRRWPLVVALAEQIPWLDQWHGEIDPRWGASPAQLYRGIAEQHALSGGRTLADIADWQPPTPTRSRKRAATKDTTS